MVKQGKQQRRARTAPSSKRSTKPTKSKSAKPVAKRPTKAPPVVAAPPPVVAAPPPVVAAPPPPVVAAPAPIKDPDLAARAAAALAAGVPLAPRPGYHLIIQRGVLSEERDEPALTAPPSAVASQSLANALKKRPATKPQPAPAPAPASPAAAPVTTKPATKPAPALVTPPTTTELPASWGKVGSGAEAYKRLLMTTDLDDAGIHAAIVAELGAAKAGPLSYVVWYKNWLRKHGYAPRGGATRG